MRSQSALLLFVTLLSVVLYVNAASAGPFTLSWPNNLQNGVAISSFFGGYQFLGQNQKSNGGCQGNSACAYCATNNAGACYTSPKYYFQHDISFTLKFSANCADGSTAAVQLSETLTDYAAPGTAGYVPSDGSEFYQGYADFDAANCANPTLNKAVAPTLLISSVTSDMKGQQLTYTWSVYINDNLYTLGTNSLLIEWAAPVASGPLATPVEGNAPPVNGAIFTSEPTGQIVNGNVKYTRKPDVWLNGGPKSCTVRGNGKKSAGISPPGWYYFMVTDPNGGTLLSLDPVCNRQIYFNDQGFLSDYRSTCTAADCLNGVCGPFSKPTDVFSWPAQHWTVTNYRGCASQMGVSLYNFADTPNPGGVYKAWITPVGSYVAGGGVNGFIHSQSKTDNFKVNLPAPTPSPTPAPTPAPTTTTTTTTTTTAAPTTAGTGPTQPTTTTAVPTTTTTTAAPTTTTTTTTTTRATTTTTTTTGNAGPCAATSDADPSAPAPTNPACAGTCACSSWELTGTGSNDLQNVYVWTHTNKCKGKVGWVAACVPPSAIIGSVDASDSCWSQSTFSAGDSTGLPCNGVKFTSLGPQCGNAASSRVFTFNTISTYNPASWQFYQYTPSTISLDPVAVTPGNSCGATVPVPTPPPGTIATTTTTTTTTTTGTTVPGQTTTTAAPTTTQKPATLPTTQPGASTLPNTPSPTKPNGKCSLPGYAPPGCNTCVDVSSIGTAYCVASGDSFVYTIVQAGQTPPANAVPRASSSLFNCDCSVKPSVCTKSDGSLGCDAGDKCICKNGVCVSDPTCAAPVVTAPPGVVCPACPSTALGVCNSAGTCNTCDGKCTCAAGYNGPACENKVRPRGCYQFSDSCNACIFDPNNSFLCGWCGSSGQAEACVDAGASCTDLSVATSLCSLAVTVTAPVCPNNCSGDNGACMTSPDTNQTTCVCNGNFHGVDCSLAGGLNVAALAGAISGGVIAAIVIAAGVVLLVIVVGTKKAVDWAMLNNMAMANSNTSPIFVDPHAEHVNPAFQHSH